MSPEEALGNLYAHVYAPVFFAKLAHYGIEPETEEEAEELLKTAASLAVLNGSAQFVESEVSADIVKEASQAIQQASGLDELLSPESEATDSDVVNLFMANDAVRRAAHTLLNAS